MIKDKGFVGIGTFEKRIGVDKPVRELRRERGESFIHNVNEGLTIVSKGIPKGKGSGIAHKHYSLGFDLYNKR